MLKEKSASFKIQSDGTFSIENYNMAKPFSSFLAGVAGPFGVPLWAFYVNRGQGIASFGVGNKDGAMMEFSPANRAYEEVTTRGFRTFFKIIRKKDSVYYEPFQNHLHGQMFDATQVMHVRPWGITFVEKNMTCGIETEVEYFTVPGEPFAAMARKVQIRNLSLLSLDLEVLDGLPKVVPYGLNDFFLKNISRTVEAWIRVEQNSSPHHVMFSRLKSDPFDRPEVKPIDQSHFFTSFAKKPNGETDHLSLVSDPGSVFGSNLDFSDPRAFLLSTPFRLPKHQDLDGKTPCAFAFAHIALEPSQVYTIYSYHGHVKDQKFKRQIPQMADPQYFQRKRQENIDCIESLNAPLQTVSASRDFDLYCRQTFLDNSLRGGVPMMIKSGKGQLPLYMFFRRHGDLERDYNQFQLEPTYLSQGEGDFRDINQNRRNDVWFEPQIKDANVITFWNLIQCDGFNPLVYKGIRLRFDSLIRVKRKLEQYLSNGTLDDFVKILEIPRSPGEIAQGLEERCPSLKGKTAEVLAQLLPLSRKVDVAENGYGHGFWSDHWSYNLDLVESYLAIFPEERENILLKSKAFTFYDNPIYVKPRRDKLIRLTNGHIRQSDATALDKKKQAMVKSRRVDACSVRTRYGKGKVYHTTLACKMLCVISNKMAALDPFGAGIEMEASRPNWLDSLNGLPALLGSSPCETYELLRLIGFLEKSFVQLRLPKRAAVALPVELATFLQVLYRETHKYLATKRMGRDLRYWEKTHNAKEAYWEKTRLGLSGAEKRIPIKTLSKMMALFSRKLKSSLDSVYVPGKGICPTYFLNEVVQHRVIKGSKTRREVIVPLRFKQVALSDFLEASVHALKCETDPQNAMKIYNSVRSSQLFDRKLGMYRVSTPLNGVLPEVGRIHSFMEGWLENQSIFLHMSYKFLLQLLKKGLAEPFFADLRTQLIAFQDPKVYGRSTLENSSFIVSSVCPQKKLHGNGFVGRLTGSTTEFIEMWLMMNIGEKPFEITAKGELQFRLRPTLPSWLFTEKETRVSFTLKDGSKQLVFIPKHSYAFLFMGRTLMVYHNPRRLPTYGTKKGIVKRMTLIGPKQESLLIPGDVLSSPHAEDLRSGKIRRLDVEIG